MSYLPSVFSPPAPSLPSIRGGFGLADALLAMLARRRRRHQMQRDYGRLLACDSHILDDIGVCRADVVKALQGLDR
jgi:uncharacterized protein YjiS (DUF1127 family)